MLENKVAPSVSSHLWSMNHNSIEGLWACQLMS